MLFGPYEEIETCAPRDVSIRSIRDRWFATLRRFQIVLPIRQNLYRFQSNILRSQYCAKQAYKLYVLQLTSMSRCICSNPDVSLRIPYHSPHGSIYTIEIKGSLSRDSHHEEQFVLSRSLTQKLLPYWVLTWKNKTCLWNFFSALSNFISTFIGACLAQFTQIALGALNHP